MSARHTCFLRTTSGSFRLAHHDRTDRAQCRGSSTQDDQSVSPAATGVKRLTELTVVTDFPSLFLLDSLSEMQPFNMQLACKQPALTAHCQRGETD
ncbi:hypothetical protein BaRGS_00014945 [Batillaria attramentaria]|uniref:Uncharacterized protein n=1 Tax=Batillaria attramentaria TaxID=370345 RepID=A0ABD0L328_9CAEN